MLPKFRFIKSKNSAGKLPAAAAGMTNWSYEEWLGNLRTACSNEDYCSPILCLEAKQRTPSPSSVAFYDMPRKVWAVCIFFVSVHTRGDFTTLTKRVLTAFYTFIPE